jgi:hypothetical protein
MSELTSQKTQEASASSIPPAQGKQAIKTTENQAS